MTEKDIQKFIWQNKDNWESLIVDIKFPEMNNFVKDKYAIYSLLPEKILYDEIIERLKRTFYKLKNLKLFGYEVPLKKEDDSTIRADFLGVIEGVSGIAIVELKKSAQTERQAYTELLAYASHLHSIFPTMCKDDITYVLISPMEERIVREATIQSFLFDEKPVFAFKPSIENEDINSFRLTPWVPSEKELVHIVQGVFSQKNFDLFKVTWERINDWNAEDGEFPASYMIERMERITSYASQLMEAKHFHGFVYTSQSFPELPLLQNAIVIAGINPFKVAKDKYLLENGISESRLSLVPDEEVNILQIIPALTNKSQSVNESNNYYFDLISTWNNTIAEIAFDVMDFMTTNDRNIKHVSDRGGMTWEEFQKNFIEDSLNYNFSIRATGIIRKLFSKYTKIDYTYIAKFGNKNHPILNHGDFPPYVVDYINEQYHFREFLLRLKDNFSGLRDLEGKDAIFTLPTPSAGNPSNRYNTGC